MTVQSEISRNDYIGNGATATYSYGFRIFAATDLLVTQVTTAGVETTLVYPTDYSVTGVGSFNNGTITLTAGVLASGYGLTIRFKSTLTQGTDLRNQGGFFPEVVEDAVDRLTRIDQQQQDELNRSIRLPETEAGSALARTLPTLATRASKYLAFDASGNPIASAAQSGAPTSAFMTTVLDDANAAAARVTLGLSTPTQAEAEAGTATTERAWTAERIGQAIAVLAQNAVRQLGQCRLVRDSATQLKLNPHNGNLIFINGVGEQVPSAGVVVTNAGLAASTLYYVYAYMNAGVMTLEFSVTASATDTTYGHLIKTADATRSYVGNVRVDAASQFPAATVGAATNVRSWFNQIHYFRADYHFFNHAVGSALATPSGIAWPFNALTASTMPEVPFLAMAKIEKAQIRWVYSSNNTGDLLYLVHFDNGPVNITTIATRTSLGGGSPVNEVDDVTTAVRNLQKDIVINKNLGYRYSASAASAFTLYRASLEILWALEDARN